MGLQQLLREIVLKAPLPHLVRHPGKLSYLVGPQLKKRLRMRSSWRKTRVQWPPALRVWLSI